MKGKKSDQAFVAQFITESVGRGIATPDEILARAKSMIANIDQEIKAIEEKKLTRSKLLDVVEAFEKQEQADKTGEAKILELFELHYPETCKLICSYIDKYNFLEIDSIDYFEFGGATHSQVKFATKQLIKANILAKYESNEDHTPKNVSLVPGPRLPEYMKYVFQGEV